MVGTHFTQNRDDGVSVLAGIDSPSSLGLPQAGSVIPLPGIAAASGESAMEPLDEDVFDLGSIAVRLVGNFDFPRLLVVEQVSKQRREEERL